MAFDPFESVFSGPKELERQQKLREEQLKNVAQQKVKAEAARKEAEAKKSAAEHLQHVKDLSLDYQKRINEFRSGSKEEEGKNEEQFFQLHKGFGLTGKVGETVIDQTRGKKKVEEGWISKRIAMGRGCGKQ